VKKKLSIVDIASALKISPTTVSFILNGKAKEKRISDVLVKRVQDYVEKVGYKPNSLARSLRTGKSNIIGLMVENIANPFFASIARLIEAEAYKNGYKIIYSSTDNDPERTKDLIRLYRERHVDGYIITPPQGIEDEVLALLKSGYPVVLFDRPLPEVKTDTVVIDNEKSMYEATVHLVKQGYRNIGIVTLDSTQVQMQARLAGYKKAIRDEGLTAHIKKLHYTLDRDILVTQIKQFLQKDDSLDAVLFATNYLGVNGLKAIRELKLSIPQQLAVIAFDDHDLFELNTPSITTIAQPTTEIAENTISLLLNRLNKNTETEAAQQLVLPANLIIRESSPTKKMTPA